MSEPIIEFCSQHVYNSPEKQVGNWKCIDGIYWEQEVKGCPEKGLCYDVRMY